MVELLYSSLYRAALVPANFTGENPYSGSGEPFCGCSSPLLSKIMWALTVMLRTTQMTRYSGRQELFVEKV